MGKNKTNKFIFCIQIFRQFLGPSELILVLVQINNNNNDNIKNNNTMQTIKSTLKLNSWKIYLFPLTSLLNYNENNVRVN